MRRVLAILIVFLGGFVIMVLEIVGARFLAKDFGSSFYVWTSQIGVILIALASGYYVGGALADAQDRIAPLAWPLISAGILTLLIPQFADKLIDLVITRHPSDRDVPLLWQKIDPAIGSALIFLLPCFALAILSPYMIRMEAKRLSHVGRTSGAIIAASTLGSIAGVFISGYVLIDAMRLTSIFYAMGTLTVLLGLLCLLTSHWFAQQSLPPGSTE
jgi:hypothetical protein